MLLSNGYLKLRKKMAMQERNSTGCEKIRRSRYILELHKNKPKNSKTTVGRQAGCCMINIQYNNTPEILYNKSIKILNFTINFLKN